MWTMLLRMFCSPVRMVWFSAVAKQFKCQVMTAKVISLKLAFENFGASIRFIREKLCDG